MILCRDRACEYCWGGLLHNHLIDDDADSTRPLRVLRWARVHRVCADERLNYATVEVRDSGDRLCGITVETWADRREAESRALEATR